MVQAEAILPQQNSFTQVAAQLAEQKRIDDYHSSMLKHEDDMRKNGILQQINPATLSKEFDPYVVNESLSGIQKSVSDYILKNPKASSNELEQFVNQALTQTALWSNKVKIVRSDLDKHFTMMGKIPGWDKETLYAAALHNALYNSDGTLKNASDINTNINWGDATLKSSPENFVDIPEAMNGFRAALKDEPYKKIAFVKKIEKNRHLVSEDHEFEIKNYQKIDDDPKSPTYGKAITNITPEIYNQYIPEGSPVDAAFNARAKQMLISNKVDPNDKSAFLKAKFTILNDEFNNADYSKQTNKTNDITKVAPTYNYNQQISEDIYGKAKGQAIAGSPIGSLDGRVINLIHNKLKDLTGKSNVKLNNYKVQIADDKIGVYKNDGTDTGIRLDESEVNIPLNFGKAKTTEINKAKQKIKIPGYQQPK
jgi:hypothetical protein